MSDSAPLPRFTIAGITDNMHLRLFALGAPQLAAGRWDTRDVQSPYWRFYRNEDDGAYLDLTDGVRFPLRAGLVYFVPAGVRFSCGNVDAAFRHFFVHFDLVGLPHLMLRTFFRGPVELPPGDDFGARVAQFAAIVRAGPGARDLALHCRAKALVYEGLARHLETVGPEAHTESLRRTAALEPFLPALEYMEAHLADRLRTGELAALCCLSEDYFARRFRDCIGQTPGEYITERRVTRAAQQILFTEDSLDAIAETCGFGSRHYLTRVFTRAIGMPPAAYRKSVRL